MPAEIPDPADPATMSGLRTYRNFNLKDTPSLSGKVAVVTGGSDGIGKEIVAQLLLHEIEKVYVLSRKQGKFDRAEFHWKEEGIVLGWRVEFISCDLNDMLSVKRVGDGLMRRLERLDILINNAGMFPKLSLSIPVITCLWATALPPVKTRNLSPQGIEPLWSTNVVGPFILTNILLPKLESTAKEFGNARIVSARSSLHMACQDLKFDSLLEERAEKCLEVVDACWRYGRRYVRSLVRWRG